MQEQVKEDLNEYEFSSKITAPIQVISSSNLYNTKRNKKKYSSIPERNMQS